MNAMASADSIQRTIATVTKEDHDRFHDAIVKLVAQFHNIGTRGGVIYWLKHEEIEREIFRLRLPIFLQWQRDLTVRFAAVLRLVNPDPSLHRRDWAQSPKDFSTRNLRCNGDPRLRWRSLFSRHRGRRDPKHNLHHHTEVRGGLSVGPNELTTWRRNEGDGPTLAG
jgi:hypothetical protein